MWPRPASARYWQPARAPAASTTPTLDPAGTMVYGNGYFGVTEANYSVVTLHLVTWAITPQRWLYTPFAAAAGSRAAAAALPAPLLRVLAGVQCGHLAVGSIVLLGFLTARQQIARVFRLAGSKQVRRRAARGLLRMEGGGQGRYSAPRPVAPCGPLCPAPLCPAPAAGAHDAAEAGARPQAAGAGSGGGAPRAHCGPVCGWRRTAADRGAGGAGAGARVHGHVWRAVRTAGAPVWRAALGARGRRSAAPAARGGRATLRSTPPPGDLLPCPPACRTPLCCA